MTGGAFCCTMGVNPSRLGIPDENANERSATTRVTGVKDTRRSGRVSLLLGTVYFENRLISRVHIKCGKKEKSNFKKRIFARAQ